MHPSRSFPLVVAALGVASAAPAFGAAPTVPGELRASVYSDYAAELFWRPSSDDGFVRGYEIRRDGALLDTLDANSYFDDALSPGTRYAYSVTAVDFDGERSAPATVSVVGGERTPPDAGGGSTSGADVAAPTGARLEIYSLTAAEVFWDRPDVPVARTEVLRDGQIIGTTDGTSFYDDTRLPGAAHAYSLVAIGPAGASSAPATVDDGGEPVAGVPFRPLDPLATLRPTAEPVPRVGGAGERGEDALDGPFGLRVVQYDTASTELFWNRIAGAVRYRLVRDGRTVRDSDAISAFGIEDLGDHELLAYDASNAVLARRGFELDARLRPRLFPSTDNLPGPEDNDFAGSVPGGETALDRLGFAGARQIARALLEGEWLDVYFDLDPRVGALVDGIAGVDGPGGALACPGGGEVRVLDVRNFGSETLSVRNQDLVFDRCDLGDGRTLDGAVTRGRSVESFHAPLIAESITLRNARLDVVAGPAQRLRFSGGAFRRRGARPEAAVCGRNRETATRRHRVNEATWTVDGTTYRLSSASFDDLLEDARFVVEGEAEIAANCRDLRVASASGIATVRSDAFGGAPATFSTVGFGVSVDPDDGATRMYGQLKADFGDGSLFSIAWLDGDPVTARVDAAAGVRAVSVLDTIEFGR